MYRVVNCDFATTLPELRAIYEREGIRTICFVRSSSAMCRSDCSSSTTRPTTVGHRETDLARAVADHRRIIGTPASSNRRGR